MIKHKDKFQHAGVCFSVTFICSMLAWKFFGPIWQVAGLILGTIVAATWGYWKEKTDDRWSWGDIVADLTGILLAWWIS